MDDSLHRSQLTFDPSPFEREGPRLTRPTGSPHVAAPDRVGILSKPPEGFLPTRCETNPIVCLPGFPEKPLPSGTKTGVTGKLQSEGEREGVGAGDRP